MLNTTSLIIEAVTSRLVSQYRSVFGHGKPEQALAIASAVRLALERTSYSDALYHDVEHTVMVVLLGTEILRGRELAERVTAEDWLHMTVALPRGASDAWLTPYHVDRSKIFVHERAEIIGGIDPERIAAAIEMTRFPIPAGAEYQESGNEGGLVRAADLIGQLADPHYLRKQTALFYEFHEIGVAQQLGYTSAADLSENYPQFFWEKVEPYIGDGLRYLALTQEGRQWIANLYAQVFTVEHQRWRMGPQAGKLTKPAPPA